MNLDALENKKSDSITMIESPDDKILKSVVDIPDELLKNMKKRNNPTSRQRKSIKDVASQLETMNEAFIGLKENIEKYGPIKTPANDLSILDDKNAVDQPILQNQAQMVETQTNNIQDVYEQLRAINGTW